MCCLVYHLVSITEKNDLTLITTPEKQDKTSELSKHWSPGSTPARNEVIMKTTYPVNQQSATKSVVINVCCYEKSDKPITQQGAPD